MTVTTNLFRNATDVRTYKAGEVIFRKGDEGTEALAVVSGEVDLLAGETLLETLGPGTLFGEMALIEHLPRSATARARTDCSLAALDARRFEFLVSQTPNFALLVMRTMADRLRRMNERT